MAMGMRVAGCVCAQAISACTAVQREGIRSKAIGVENSLGSGPLRRRIGGACAVAIPSASERSRRRGVVCQVDLSIGHSQSSEGQETATTVGPGSRIRVKTPLTVYHVMKAPNLDIQGLEGEVKEVIGQWKGKPVSATFPVKTQFTIEVDGKPVKFFAHLKDDEYELVQ